MITSNESHAVASDYDHHDAAERKDPVAEGDEMLRVGDDVYVARAISKGLPERRYRDIAYQENDADNMKEFHEVVGHRPCGLEC